MNPSFGSFTQFNNNRKLLLNAIKKNKNSEIQPFYLWLMKTTKKIKRREFFLQFIISQLSAIFLLGFICMHLICCCFFFAENILIQIKTRPLTMLYYFILTLKKKLNIHFNTKLSVNTKSCDVTNSILLNFKRKKKYKISASHKILNRNNSLITSVQIEAESFKMQNYFFLFCYFYDTLFASPFTTGTL